MRASAVQQIIRHIMVQHFRIQRDSGGKRGCRGAVPVRAVHAQGSHGHDRRSGIRAVDRERQGVGGRAAVPVVHSVGKDILKREAQTKILHLGLIVVQGVNIGAVSLEREVAVQAVGFVLGHIGRQIMDVRVMRGGQYPLKPVARGAAQNRRHRKVGVCRGNRGRVVLPVDGDLDHRACRAAVPVHDSDREGLGEGFAHAEPQHGRGMLVKHIGIGTVGVDDQGAVAAGCAAGLAVRRIVAVRVRDVQQARDDAAAVLRNGKHHRQHLRRVVGSVDGNGDGACGGLAQRIRGRKGEGFRELLTHAQCHDRGQAGIQLIVIRAVGLKRQAAVQPHTQAQARVVHQGVDHVAHGIEGSRHRPDHIGHRIHQPVGNGIQGKQAAEAALDGYGQGIGRRAAVPVRHCIGEGVGQLLVEKQADHGQQAGVQSVHIRAVGVEGQSAVAAELIAFGSKSQGVADDMIQVVVRVRGRDEPPAEGGVGLDHDARGSAH